MWFASEIAVGVVTTMICALIFKMFSRDRVKAWVVWLSDGHQRWKHRWLTRIILLGFHGRAERESRVIVFSLPVTILLAFSTLALLMHFEVRRTLRRFELAEQSARSLVTGTPQPSEKVKLEESVEEAEDSAWSRAFLYYGSLSVFWIGVLTAVVNMATYVRNSGGAFASSLLEAYMSRLVAIATKAEIRDLAVLELNVDDEVTLFHFFTKLLELSRQYNFPFNGTFTKWMAQHEGFQQQSGVPAQLPPAS